MATITLRVLFFSILRDQVGRDAMDVRLEAPATGTALLDYLQREHPPLRAFRPVLRIAVNQEYVSETRALADGDEVALITPVSGG